MITIRNYKVYVLVESSVDTYDIIGVYKTKQSADEAYALFLRNNYPTSKLNIEEVDFFE